MALYKVEFSDGYITLVQWDGVSNIMPEIWEVYAILHSERDGVTITRISQYTLREN